MQFNIDNNMFGLKTKNINFHTNKSCFISVTNYGLAGEYSVHADVIQIFEDEKAEGKMIDKRNIYYGDRAVTVKI